MKNLVIGVGHPFRGDDAAGPMVAESLRGTAGIDVLVHHGEGSDLMERWAGYDAVVVVDATCSGVESTIGPGTIRVWDAVAQPLPAGLFPKGSHVFGPAEGVEMARILDRLPPSLTVISVEGRAFAAGEAMSPEVDAAIPHAKRKIMLIFSQP